MYLLTARCSSEPPDVNVNHRMHLWTSMQHATVHEQEQLWIIRCSYELAVADAIACEMQLWIGGCYWKTGRWNCGSAQLWIAWCNNEPPGAKVSNGESADINVNQQMWDCDHQRQPWTSRCHWESTKMQLRDSRCNSKPKDLTMNQQMLLEAFGCNCGSAGAGASCEP